MSEILTRSVLMGPMHDIFFSSFDIKLGAESIETLKHMKQSKRLLSYPSLVEIVEGGLLFVHFCIRLCKTRQLSLRKAWKISALE